MTEDARSIIFSVPFAKWTESRQSPRYTFRNDERGQEQFVIIQWTHSGSGRVSFEDRTYPAGPEEAFILTVPEPSAYYYPAEGEAPWTFSWINFYSPIAVDFCRRFRAIHGPVIPLRRQGIAGQMLESLIREAERRVPQDAYEQSSASFAFFMAWSRELDSSSGKADNPVDLAARICRTRFREPIGVKQLADAAGVSREHLTREFLRKLRVSPAHYLRKLRATAARRMLREHGSSLSETALRCGFPSVKAMHRAFRRVRKS